MAIPIFDPTSGKKPLMGQQVIYFLPMQGNSPWNRKYNIYVDPWAGNYPVGSGATAISPTTAKEMLEEDLLHSQSLATEYGKGGISWEGGARSWYVNPRVLSNLKALPEAIQKQLDDLQNGTGIFDGALPSWMLYEGVQKFLFDAPTPSTRYFTPEFVAYYTQKNGHPPFVGTELEVWFVEMDSRGFKVDPATFQVSPSMVEIVPDQYVPKGSAGDPNSPLHQPSDFYVNQNTTNTSVTSTPEAAKNPTPSLPDSAPGPASVPSPDSAPGPTLGPSPDASPGPSLGPTPGPGLGSTGVDAASGKIIELDDYADEASDTSSPLGVIHQGTPLQGFIGPPDNNDSFGDKDAFTVELSKGHTYQIRMQSINVDEKGLPQSIFTLRSPENFETVLSTSSIGADVSITYTASDTGNYYIRTGTGGKASDQGGYQLTVEKIPSAIPWEKPGWSELLLQMAQFSKAAYWLLEENTKFNLPGEPIEPQANKATYKSIDARGALTPKWSFLDADDLTDTGRSLIRLSSAQDVKVDQYFGFTPALVPSFVSSADGYDYQFRDGIFTNRNAAALVAVSGDVLVVAFRGTNDIFDISNDQIAWLDLYNHWFLFQPLIKALDNYVITNKISNVYVTGHSLGASMALAYMEDPEHEPRANVSYSGIAFASPGYGALDDHDPSFSNFLVEGDIIERSPKDKSGDENVFHLGGITFPIQDPGFNTALALHSMGLYLHVAERLADAKIDLPDLSHSSGTKIDFDNIYLKVTGTKNATNSDFDFMESKTVNPLYGHNTKPSVLVGTSYKDILYAGEGNDWLIGSGESDNMFGGAGIDTALYSGNRSNYSITSIGTQAWIKDNTLVDGIDDLRSIERLKFQDFSIALDFYLNGNARKTATLLGAVFGKSAVSDMGLVGEYLHSLDEDMDYSTLLQQAINTRLGPDASHRAVVDLLYTNLFGEAPTETIAQIYLAMLPNQFHTVAGLAEFAANSSQNSLNIDLVGLSVRGLAFTEFGSTIG